MRRTRWARRRGSSSLKTSSSRSRGGSPSGEVSRWTSASLRARIAVRCWPREANAASGRSSRRKTMSSRWGPTRVAPFHSSLSAVSASRRRMASAGDSDASRRRVGHVAHRQAALTGRDLGVGRRQRLRPGRPAWPDGRPRSRRPRRRGARPSRAAGRVPAVPSRIARSRLLRWARARPYVASARPWPGERAAARASRAARRRAGEPTTRSISSGAKRTTRNAWPRAGARRGTPLMRMRLRAAAPVAGRGITTSSDVGPVRRPVADPGLEAGQVRRPGHQLGVRGPVRAAAGQHDERLDQVGLARRVRPVQDLRARAAARRRARRSCGSPSRPGDRRASLPSGACGHGRIAGRQDGVRTGMMTCT